MIRKLLSYLLFLSVSTTFGQNEKFTINGTVKDAGTGEDLIGVTISIRELPGTGAITNSYGFYAMNAPKGEYTLVYRYIGYLQYETTISLASDQRLEVELVEEGVQMDEVVIVARKEDENVTAVETGVVRLTPKEIEAVPVIFGEKDVMKTIQLMPGIQTAGEGNAGFYVRGGSADQNLILLDEAPVYNASHLLGFFSVFNSDAIKDVELIKGNMPAQYGGRLSSVMDVKMKDGNSKDFGVSGGLGLISSRLTVEGPIVEDKGSFIVSGRRTYADAFLGFSNDETLQDTRLYFYDLNAKANYKIGEKDRIYLSGYFGRDNFNFGDQFGFNWGNATGTVRWNHLYNNRLFSNTSLIYSNYSYEIGLPGDEGVNISSAIKDWNLKQDYQFYANDKNNLSFGWNAIYHTFSPGSLDSGEGDNFNDTELEDKYGLETAFYISNEQKITSRFSANYGIRLSTFSALGPGDVFSYDAEGNVSDTVFYQANEIIRNYGGIEPRLTLSYLTGENSALKTSYARTYQYVHLLSNSTTTTPTDIWIPSSNNVKPEIADQWAFGYYQNFADNQYEFSIEGYYKDMQNVIDYKTGAEINLNPTIEGDLVYGNGRAYGVEFFLRKRTGKFTGWISYTLSRSERQFDEINQGEWFAARQDRTHDISVVGMYKLNDRVTLSGTWVYYTGNAVTFPSGKYRIDGQVVNYYTERNGYRMPDYHRLDLGLTLEGKSYKMKRNPETGVKEKTPKRYQDSWNFSLYNAYGRENAYSISFEESQDNPGTTEAVQLSLFKYVPSVTYNFNF